MVDKAKILNQIEDTEPTVSIDIYQVDTDSDNHTGLAVHVNFGKKGMPESYEDATIPQILVMALSNHLTKLMEEMEGDATVLDGDGEGKVLSSSNSKEKDAIDKQLEELGITPQHDKEVH